MIQEFFLSETESTVKDRAANSRPFMSIWVSSWILRSVNNLFYFNWLARCFRSSWHWWMVSSTHPSCVSQSRDFTCPLWQVLLSGKCLCVAFPQQPCWFHRKLPVRSESVVRRSTQQRQRAEFPSSAGPSQLLASWSGSRGPCSHFTICHLLLRKSGEEGLQLGSARPRLKLIFHQTFQWLKNFTGVR